MDLNLYRIDFRDNHFPSPIFSASEDRIAPIYPGAPQAPRGHVYAQDARQAARAYWDSHNHVNFRPDLRVARVINTERTIATYRAVPVGAYEIEVIA